MTVDNLPTTHHSPVTQWLGILREPTVLECIYIEKKRNKEIKVRMAVAMKLEKKRYQFVLFVFAVVVLSITGIQYI